MAEISARIFGHATDDIRLEDELVPWSGHTGHVQELWNKGVIADAWGFPPTPENTHVFLCGNPFMIRDMEEMLQQQGFRMHDVHSPGQIHVERV